MFTVIRLSAQSIPTVMGMGKRNREDRGQKNNHACYP